MAYTNALYGRGSTEESGDSPAWHNAAAIWPELQSGIRPATSAAFPRRSENRDIESRKHL